MKTKLIIFGITGDLSTRKLLPALTDIVKNGEGDELSIIGVSRRDVSVSDLILESTHDQTLVDRTVIFTMNLAAQADYQELKRFIDLQADEQAVIYLSVPPSAATDIVDFLGKAEFNQPNVKIMFEKPFGFDLASAHEMIQRSNRYFDEAQMYRIDHYMAKEVAAEVLRLRGSATSKQHGWSNAFIKSVHIVASETLGVEDRAAFYEQTGALRDVIQGHLLQLLSLVLLDTRGAITLDELPKRRFAALEYLAVVTPAQAVRSQYQGYDEAVGNRGSTTETFAQVQLASKDPRWEGVPLYLTTGKMLNEKRTAITIEYKDGSVETLVEGEVGLKDGRLQDAYERVLIEAIQGRKAIFTTSPELLRAWEILADVQQAWQFEKTNIAQYPQGATVKEALHLASRQ